jgi:hypothetical protein
MQQDNKNKFLHMVQENSCFFQGHIGQFFTKDHLTYKIISNTFDSNETERINIERYKHRIATDIQKFLSIRNEHGGLIRIPKEDEIQFKYINLVESSKEEEENTLCGYYQIYPKTAICTKDNCNEYFRLDKTKECGHRSDTDWDQINFVGFCDICGRSVPIEYASNIGKKCSSCGINNALRIILWGRSRDDLGSWKLKCKNCSKITGLFYFECDHFNRTNNERYSENSKEKFRAVTTRLGTLVHPVVLAIPDISGEDASTPIYERKSMSGAFSFFFPDQDETILDVAQLRELLSNDIDFYKLPRVSYLLEEMGISSDSFKGADGQGLFKKTIRILLKRAREVYSVEDHSKIVEMYGISFIERALKLIPKNIHLNEDWEGIFLINKKSLNNHTKFKDSANSTEPTKLNGSYKVRSVPTSVPSEMHADWLKKNYLGNVIHVSGLNMVQCIIGIIEGSTRNEVKLFNVLLTGRPNHKKPTVYFRNFVTEGILFQLDYQRMFEWLKMNNKNIGNIDLAEYEVGQSYETSYQQIVSDHEEYRSAAYKLLHTYSHMLMQQSTVHTGLDIQSLSEKIYPAIASVFIYATNPINIGGLESTFDIDLQNWLKKMVELSSDCPQDPSCMLDEDGACNACSFAPEFVCTFFNQDLDRSTLVGKSKRYEWGYLVG